MPLYQSQFSRDALSNHMIKKVGYGYASGEAEYNRREECLVTVTYQGKWNTTVEKSVWLRLQIRESEIQP